MSAESTTSFQYEQHRLVTAAYDLFTERGIDSVTLSEVARNARLPEAAITRCFPAGKDDLVAAAADRHLAAFAQRLADTRQLSSSAVEEMLRVRRTLADTPAETRNAFLRELARTQAGLFHQLESTQQALILDYMRRNMDRGQAEALYLLALDVEAEAQQWLRQASENLRTSPDAQTMAEKVIATTNDFLRRVTTPAGAYLVRRLQEAEPYY